VDLNSYEMYSVCYQICNRRSLDASCRCAQTTGHLPNRARTHAQHDIAVARLGENRLRQIVDIVDENGLPVARKSRLAQRVGQSAAICSSNG
jgi:hypothetical protein